MKSISKIKKELDKWFSLFIRLRDATNEGLCQCFTCGKVDHYKKLQCGHFMSRRHHSTRWNEVNCQVQCVKCNMFGQGEQYKFGLNLDSKWGEGTSEELQYEARQIVKITRPEYEGEISYYKSLVNKFKKEKEIE
ncbi:MAG: recombinase [Flavobacteriaceae bacterium]|nr:recombinase [Flavobacteriaceae bacterium]